MAALAAVPTASGWAIISSGLKIFSAASSITSSILNFSSSSKANGNKNADGIETLSIQMKDEGIVTYAQFMPDIVVQIEQLAAKLKFYSSEINFVTQSVQLSLTASKNKIDKIFMPKHRFSASILLRVSHALRSALGHSGDILTFRSRLFVENQLEEHDAQVFFQSEKINENSNQSRKQFQQFQIDNVQNNSTTTITFTQDENSREQINNNNSSRKSQPLLEDSRPLLDFEQCKKNPWKLEHESAKITVSKRNQYYYLQILTQKQQKNRVKSQKFSNKRIPDFQKKIRIDSDNIAQLKLVDDSEIMVIDQNSLQDQRPQCIFVEAHRQLKADPCQFDFVNQFQNHELSKDREFVDQEEFKIQVVEEDINFDTNLQSNNLDLKIKQKQKYIQNSDKAFKQSDKYCIMPISTHLTANLELFYMMKLCYYQNSILKSSESLKSSNRKLHHVSATDEQLQLLICSSI